MSLSLESNGPEPKRARVFPSSLLPDKASINPTPVYPSIELPKSTRWYIAETPDQCLQIAKQMLAVCRAADISVWGFDIEWWVSYEKGTQRPTALIQFHRNNDAILFHVARCGYCEDLFTILKDPKIFKVGIAISGDKCKLERDVDYIRYELCGYVDLRHVFEKVNACSNVKFQLASSGRGLADMVHDYLSLRMLKPESLRRGNWENLLSGQMKLYAALDAYAGSTLFNFLCNHCPNINMPAILEALALSKTMAHNCIGSATLNIETNTKDDSVVKESLGSFDDGNGKTIDVKIITQTMQTPIHSPIHMQIPDRLSHHASLFLDDHNSIFLKTNLIETIMAPHSKDSAMSMFMKAEGRISLDALARKKGVKTSTFASYIAECISVGYPYVFDFFRISNFERDFIVSAFASFFYSNAGQLHQLEGLVMKTRRYIFRVHELLQERHCVHKYPNTVEHEEIQYFKLQLVDAHLYRCTGVIFWEILFPHSSK